jgi:hypothetical protein
MGLNDPRQDHNHSLLKKLRYLLKIHHSPLKFFLVERRALDAWLESNQ